jgi:hypothetical protein
VPQRYPKRASVAPYIPFIISNAISTLTPVGRGIASTAPGPIAIGTQTITPANMTNITPGRLLNVGDGASSEDVRVISITGTTFTAIFQKTHAGTVTLTSRSGTILGGLLVSQIGSGVTIEIHNGHPNLSPNPVDPAYGTVAMIAPMLGYEPLPMSLDYGLFIKVTGVSIGYYTLLYDDMP